MHKLPAALGDAMSRQPRLFEPEALWQPAPGNEELRVALALWKKYKKEQWGFTYKPVALGVLVDRLARFEAEGVAEGLGPGEALRAVHFSLHATYRGVFREPVSFAQRRERRAVLELQAPGIRAVAPAFDIAPRLAALAAAIPEGLNRLRPPLVALASAGMEIEAVEKRLAEIDLEMLAAAREGLKWEDAEAILAGVERTLALAARQLDPLGRHGRLPAEEGAIQRERLFAQGLRRRLGLPVLSLFSPEAEPR